MQAKVISVENRKGGVGKTTTAVILAVALARQLAAEGKRVLLMDTDPQGDAATAVHVEPGMRCLSGLLLDTATFTETIVPIDSLAPPLSNLYLLPASDQLTDTLALLNRNLGAMSLLAQQNASSQKETIPSITDIFLQATYPLKEAFQYIIIDCPPSLGTLREAIHQFADYAVVPVRPDYHSVQQTARHTHDILEDRARGIDIRILAVVPTFVQSNHLLTKEMMQKLRQAYGEQLTQPIPLTTAIAQAPALGGLTVLEHAPTSLATLAYQDLIQRVLSA